MASGFELNEFLMQNPFSQFLIGQNASRIGPEFLILACILFSITASFNPSLKDRQSTWGIALMGTLFALALFLFEMNLFVHLPQEQKEIWLNNTSVFYGMFQADLFSLVVRFLLVFGTVIVLLFSRKAINDATRVPAEFYVLLLTALLGAMLMVGANDLIMLFVGMETLGISSYIMAGYLRGDIKSTEASLKYLIYGGVSTAILLFGFSLLYGYTGETSYPLILAKIMELRDASAMSQFDMISYLPLVAVLILGGIAFKLSAAPFHMWTPDVYEGAPTPVTAFLSVVSKMAGFAVATRLMYGLLPIPELWSVAIMGVACLSMIIGNLVALTQRNIKRLLAYSTIAHAGYMLIGLCTLSVAGASSMFYYLLTYLFMNLGAFAVVIYFHQLTGSDEIKAYAGLIQKRPMLAVCMSFFLLSLAGMPVTAGFFAKFFVFQSLAEMNGDTHLWIVVLALLTSTVSMFYYLNVIRLMVVAEPSPEVTAIPDEVIDPWKPTGVGTAIGISFIGTVLMGFYSGVLIECSKFTVEHMWVMYQRNYLRQAMIQPTVPEKRPLVGMTTVSKAH